MSSSSMHVTCFPNSLQIVVTRTIHLFNVYFYLLYQG